MPRFPIAALGAALLACALLAWNASFRPNLALEDLRPAGRYWEDLALSGSAYLSRGSEPSTTLVNGTAAAEDLKHGYRRNLVRGAQERQIAPWQFWRTVPLRPFLNRGRIVQRRYEDAGRSQLMALAYRPLGGIAPYFGLWVALLCALPALVWVCWELARAGLPLAGTTFALACGSSCFAADVLTMAYSAAGFHLVALLLLTGLGVFACLRPAPSKRGLLVRALLVGLAFLVCCLCRASTLSLLPAFLSAIGVAAWRIARSESRTPTLRRALPLILAGAGVFLLPYGARRALATPSAHDVWATVWEGLGDFDRSKGFVWSDPHLRAFLRSKGMAVSEKDGIEFQGVQSEALTRAAVLGAIREDPGWYAAILVKRVAATATFFKLWPYGPWDGRSMAASTHPNEGSTDVYWSMTRTADFFACGPWAWEAPASLLVAPLPILLLNLLGAWRRESTVAAAQLGLLGLLAMGALALPVAISVSASFEPQSYLLLPLLALGLLVQRAYAALARRLPPLTGVDRPWRPGGPARRARAGSQD